MNYREIEKQKELEAETQAYKQFMKIAKKVSYLQYGKWNIVPDLGDPLRKFTLEKDAGWATVKLSLIMIRSYHRGKYGQDRYYYKPMLVCSGQFKNVFGKLNMSLKPRMARKIVKVVDEGVIPYFYNQVEQEKANREKLLEKEREFKDKISAVKGLRLGDKLSPWTNSVIGNLTNCPFVIEVNPTAVTLSQTFTFEQLAELSKQYGWGNK